MTVPAEGDTRQSYDPWPTHSAHDHGTPMNRLHLTRPGVAVPSLLVVLVAVIELAKAGA